MKTLIFALSIALFIPAPAAANECDTGATPCDAYARADSVFVGRVERISPESFTMRQAVEGYDHTAYVTVERVFKGKARGRIILRQLKRDKAPTFIARDSYLFYADYDETAKRWHVRPCGRTRMAEFANDDLRYLTGLPKSAGRTRLAGEVTRYDADEATQGTTERLAGVRLTITGESGEYEAVTDAGGVYELYDLPPGEYTVRARLPAGLRLLYMVHHGAAAEMRERAHDPTVEVRAGGCAGVGLILTADAVPPRDVPERIGRRDSEPKRGGDLEAPRR